MIKYGELSTKKDNIKVFIDKLNSNVSKKLADYDVSISKNKVRMFIDIKDYNEVDIISKLKEVFGIHSIVVCYKCNKSIEDINILAKELIDKENITTFKVETNRADKSFKYNSLEVSKMVGAYLLKNVNGLKVDVHNPEITLHVEIRDDNTYLYTKEIKGLGGYPVGIQGKGLLMLSGGIDSPVAGFLASKRGIDIDCIYFDSPPHTSLEAKNKVITLAKKLCNYGNNINLYVIPFTEIQLAIYKNIEPTYIITILRRMMYRISERVAKMTKSRIIINGESIGQVASQTLTSMSVINSVTNMPVIRPVACLDKLEIIDIAKKIDTYDISILPYEDCCTVFVPKHPVINPNGALCEEYETLIPYKELIYKAIKEHTTIKVGIKEENKFSDLL